MRTTALVLLASMALACTDGGTSDAGVARDAGRMDAARPDAGPPADTGPRPDAAAAVTCESLGGTCGCVSGCGEGTSPDPRASLCPQPCDDCGGCAQECCLPHDDPPTDAGGADAGSCEVLPWTMATLFDLGRACGVFPSEGQRLCLAATVADGLYTAVSEGSRNEVPIDADALSCLEGRIVGRCHPDEDRADALEQCALGF